MNKHAPPPELFTLRVPCALHPDGQHDIALQIAHHNWVSLRFTCNRKSDEAARALGDIVTCGLTVALLRAAIISRNAADVAVGRCQRCDALVAPLREGCCPLPDHRGSGGKFIDDLPFWARLCRTGRLRRK